MNKLISVVLKNPTASLMIGWAIVFPIYVIGKNMLNGYHEKYPSVSRYEQQFKKFHYLQNEQSKPDKTLF